LTPLCDDGIYGQHVSADHRHRPAAPMFVSCGNRGLRNNQSA
jgi:hypothetical protein